VGTAGYELADGGGWRTPWCRQVRIVGGRRSWGWVLCRSGRRISGGLVWMKTMLSLQEGECHVGPNFGGSQGTSWQLPIRIGGEGEWSNRVVTEKESAEHWTLNKVKTDRSNAPGSPNFNSNDVYSISRAAQ